MTVEPSIVGREHWTRKGDVRYRIPYHILHSFFSQPAPVYRGA
jgi:hypothetical protein